MNAFSQLGAVADTLLGGLFRTLRPSSTVAKSDAALMHWFRRSMEGGSLTAGKLQKPLAQSVWIQSAITLIAGPIASVPLLITSDARGGEAAVRDPKLDAWLEMPAHGLDRTSLLYASVLWWKAVGEVFYLLDDSAIVPFPAQRAALPKITLARPDRMRHVTSGGQLTGWEFTDGAGRKHALLPEQVVHVRRYNPYDDFRGLGEMESALIAAEADYLGSKFELNVAANNGDQGPYLVAKSGVPDDRQREQIIAAIREKKEAALKGIFKPVFLGGDIDVKDPMVQTIGTDHLNSRLRDAETVYIALGVPASMSSKTVAYSIGSAADVYRLIEMTCKPTGRQIVEGLETVVRRLTGTARLYLDLDWDEHWAMQAVIRERMAQVPILADRGMPMQKVSQYLALGLPEFPGWDKGYIPFSLNPVETGQPSDQSDPPQTPDPKPQTPDPALEGAKKAIAKLFDPVGRVAPRAPQVTRAASAAFTRADRDRAPFRKKYELNYTTALWKMRGQVLAKLEAVGRVAPRAPQVTKSVAADFLFAQSDLTQELKERFSKVSRAAIQDAGAKVFADLDPDHPFLVPNERVVQHLLAREQRIKDMSAEVWEAIKAALEEGLNAGETLDELADRVRGEFNVGKDRARIIATTETTAAYEFGRVEGMKAAGVERKQWLHSGLDNGRDSHIRADGDIVGVDEPFDIGGEAMMYPGDTNASPENVINCRCIVVPVVDEVSDEEAENG